MLTQKINKRLLPLLPFFLFGCANDPGPDYPPLKKEQLVGCWVQVVPETWLSCQEQCFSKTGTYYAIGVQLPNSSGGKDYYEQTGTYRITGGVTIDLALFSTGNIHQEIDSLKASYNSSIIRDTFNFITDGHPQEPWTRSDSAKNCGSHWRLFPKPADWELP